MFQNLSKGLKDENDKLKEQNTALKAEIEQLTATFAIEKSTLQSNYDNIIAQTNSANTIKVNSLNAKIAELEEKLHKLTEEDRKRNELQKENGQSELEKRILLEAKIKEMEEKFRLEMVLF